MSTITSILSQQFLDLAKAELAEHGKASSLPLLIVTVKMWLCSYEDTPAFTAPERACHDALEQLRENLEFAERNKITLAL